jgi:hypothetical protein
MLKDAIISYLISFGPETIKSFRRWTPRKHGSREDSLCGFVLTGISQPGPNFIPVVDKRMEQSVIDGLDRLMDRHFAVQFLIRGIENFNASQSSLIRLK